MPIGYEELWKRLKIRVGALKKAYIEQEARGIDSVFGSWAVTMVQKAMTELESEESECVTTEQLTTTKS